MTIWSIKLNKRDCQINQTDLMKDLQKAAQKDLLLYQPSVLLQIRVSIDVHPNYYSYSDDNYHKRFFPIKNSSDQNDDVHSSEHNDKYHPVMVERKKDRKSTRLNSSHQIISYAVFCL